MEKIECSVCNGATVSRRIYRNKKYMYSTCIHSILFYTQNSCEQCWRNAFQFRYIHKYKICRDVYIAAYVNIIVFSSMYSKSSGKRAAVECTKHLYTHTYINSIACNTKFRLSLRALMPLGAKIWCSLLLYVTKQQITHDNIFQPKCVHKVCILSNLMRTRRRHKIHFFEGKLSARDRRYVLNAICW